MKENYYLLTYSSKGRTFQEPLSTFQIIIYLLLSKINKKVDVFSIEYNSFLSDKDLEEIYSSKVSGSWATIVL